MFPSLQLADWKAHKNTCHLNVEMEAALDAEQKAWTKQKAVSAAGHQFFTGGSSSPQKAIIFAVIWGVLLSFYGAIILATFHQRSQVVHFLDYVEEKEACSEDDSEAEELYASEYDSKPDPCYTELMDLYECLILPGVLRLDNREGPLIEGAWADLSYDERDAYNCAEHGILWLYDIFGMDPITDDICNGDIGTEEEICSELVELKDCIEEADECKSEALALLKCRDWKDGGCGCPW